MKDRRTTSYADQPFYIANSNLQDRHPIC
jgi:hypothetical protein